MRNKLQEGFCDKNSGLQLCLFWQWLTDSFSMVTHSSAACCHSFKTAGKSPENSRRFSSEGFIAMLNSPTVKLVHSLLLKPSPNQVSIMFSLGLPW